MDNKAIIHRFTFLMNSIGTRIIIPYVLLTLIVTGVGAYIITNLVTETLRERIDNQLLDAGRVVSDSMVAYEQQRISVLRAIASTEGVPESLISGDVNKLISLVPQIVANNNTDAVVLLDSRGNEIYNWYSGRQVSLSSVDYSQYLDVRLVLNGYVDEAGNKRAVLIQTPNGYILFTLGPVFMQNELVGVVLVGTDVRSMVLNLTETAIARVTLYETNGFVIESTLAAGQENIIDLLQESPQRYEAITLNAEKQVPVKQVSVRNQNYLLGFGDWRIRGQSFGFYSVALPSNFIISAAATSRNSMSLVFSLATIAVFAIGYFIARRIVTPIDQLVQTSVAVTKGNIDRRTGIQRRDEIGVLAEAFDVMTETLAKRNAQLLEQTSNLQAILHSIADGVLMLDDDYQVVITNPTAQKILRDVTHSAVEEMKRTDLHVARDVAMQSWLRQLTEATSPQRYRVGRRVYSALPSPVTTPLGQCLGYVVVMRDITRDVEAEERQNYFISSVSHELRTPLTAIKGFISLLISSGKDSLNEQNLKFAEVIHENTDKLIVNVNGLIDIAEIQAGTLQLHRERVSFTDIVQETVATWTEKAELKDLVLDIDLSNDKLWVSGDPARLTWAIQNLMRNAFDYTLPGGRIKVQICPSNGEAHLVIVDTGIGINSNDLPHVFDRFFRVENDVTLEVRGMGLGLYIVRYIVEGHDGRVWVKSEPNMGSTFGFALPLLENQAK